MKSPVPTSQAVQSVADGLIAIGVALTAIAPMVLAVELGEWLTNSEWPGWSLADGIAAIGLGDPQSHWTRAQQYVDIFTALPLALALFGGGILTFMSGIDLSEWGIKHDRARSDRGHAL